MLERILLAVDGSEHARKAIPATIELARAGQETVHVLHVRELAYASASVGSPSHRFQAVRMSRRCFGAEMLRGAHP